jgi:predicted GNAT family acetyltransferase
VRRRGFGRALAEHSVDEARRRGFDAMLFTLVLDAIRADDYGSALASPRSAASRTAVDGQSAYIYWRSLVQSSRHASLLGRCERTIPVVWRPPA